MRRAWILREIGEVRPANHGEYYLGKEDGKIHQLITSGPSVGMHSILSVTEAPSREEWEKRYEEWSPHIITYTDAYIGWMAAYDLIFGKQQNPDSAEGWGDTWMGW